MRPFYTPALAKIVELRDKGLTWDEVAAELSRQGFRTRTGKPYRHGAQPLKIWKSFGG